MRLRVAHIIQNLNYGGMERLLADLVRCTNPALFENHVIVLQYRGRFAEGLEGFGTVHLCPPLPRWSLVWPGPLIRLLREIAPAVVHSHSGVWYKASFAARRARVPRVIHTEHGLPSQNTWLSRRLERAAVRRTDAVVAVSEALATALAANGLPAAAIRIVPNGVDTDRFAVRPDTGALRRAWGLAPETPVIGSIGRLEPVKAYDVMIEAFAQLRGSWRHPGAPPVLVIAGDGSERRRLEALAASRGVADAVRLPGWRDDIHDLHAMLQVFSLSSLSEGTSVSLLEAMSAGRCPVVTRVGGNAAVLGPDLAHRLVPPNNPVALAAAWTDALRDTSRRNADAAAARRRVQAAFSLQAMVRRYEALYREPPA